MRVLWWPYIVAMCGLWCAGANAGEQAPAGGKAPAEIEQPLPAAENAHRKLAALEAQGATWRVSWSDKTGLPRMIFGDKSKPHAGSADEAARAFIDENADLLGLPAPAAGRKPAEPPALEMRTTGETDMAAGKRVSLQQYCRGIPVFNAVLDVCTDAAGAVWHVTSTVQPQIDVEAPPADQLKGLDEWLKKPDVANEQPVVKGAPELVIYPDGPGKPAWKFLCTFGGKNDHWQILIDAMTGDVLRKTHLVMTD